MRTETVRELIAVMVDVVRENGGIMLRTSLLLAASRRAGVSVGEMPYILNSAVADDQLNYSPRTNAVTLPEVPTTRGPAPEPWGVPLQLDSLLYLPMSGDGLRLNEPTELRAKVTRPSAGASPVVTVTPHMKDDYLVTLYRTHVPSRKIPDLVQETVNAFNADTTAGWKRLLVEHADRQGKAAQARLYTAERDITYFSKLSQLHW